MSIVDEKRVKFTSFESHCTYNVLCLTFRGNLWVLIERKTLGTISRKDRGTKKPRTTKESKPEERTAALQRNTTVLQKSGPCRATHGYTQGCAWAHSCPCVEALPCGLYACKAEQSLEFFKADFLILFWGRPLLARFS